MQMFEFEQIIIKENKCKVNKKKKKQTNICTSLTFPSTAITTMWCFLLKAAEQ